MAFNTICGHSSTVCSGRGRAHSSSSRHTRRHSSGHSSGRSSGRSKGGRHQAERRGRETGTGARAGSQSSRIDRAAGAGGKAGPAVRGTNTAGQVGMQSASGCHTPSSPSLSVADPIGTCRMAPPRPLLVTSSPRRGRRAARATTHWRCGRSHTASISGPPKGIRCAVNRPNRRRMRRLPKDMAHHGDDAETLKQLPPGDVLDGPSISKHCFYRHTVKKSHATRNSLTFKPRSP